MSTTFATGSLPITWVAISAPAPAAVPTMAIVAPADPPPPPAGCAGRAGSRTGGGLCRRCRGCEVGLRNRRGGELFLIPRLYLDLNGAAAGGGEARAAAWPMALVVTVNVWAPPANVAPDPAVTDRKRHGGACHRPVIAIADFDQRAHRGLRLNDVHGAVAGEDDDLECRAPAARPARQRL